ncbi:MAG: hypothetical protein R3D26_07870 [Cyanobacteriota/Melainabacteria group bacterium]
MLFRYRPDLVLHLFAVSETAGWIAHAIEQRKYGGAGKIHRQIMIAAPFFKGAGDITK